MLTEKEKQAIAERKEFNIKKRPRGRPPKKEVQAKKKGNRNAVGRPKGDSAIMEDYKARMLASPKSKKVLQTILDAALDDDHRHQAAAWKLVMDRMLPVGMFEKEVVKGSGRNAIQINITGVTSAEVEDVPINGEFEQVDD